MVAVRKAIAIPEQKTITWIWENKIGSEKPNNSPNWLTVDRRKYETFARSVQLLNVTNFERPVG